MEFEQIVKLINHVSDSELTAFRYETENVRLLLKKGKKIEMKAADIPENSLEDTNMIQKTGGNIMSSPLVGTFYSAPSEDAKPYVAVGDKVKKGQVIAIVEAMKLMNEIESDFDGEIAEIYVKNAQTIEYGQPLFRIV